MDSNPQLGFTAIPYDNKGRSSQNFKYNRFQDISDGEMVNTEDVRVEEEVSGEKKKFTSKNIGKNIVEENKLASLSKHHFKHPGDLEGSVQKQQDMGDCVIKDGGLTMGFHVVIDPKEIEPLDLQGMPTSNDKFINLNGEPTSVKVEDISEALEQKEVVTETPLGN
ncbi:unnamed protein product [Vicia faba]|uniref:Uncharacterized protein n=1 Tax=Vicia faba TaxID=3906 RepID=A0AAV0ZTS7_VICFA|nr:unnamed protein product [Vicia faba]